MFSQSNTGYLCYLNVWRSLCLCFSVSFPFPSVRRCPECVLYASGMDKRAIGSVFRMARTLKMVECHGIGDHQPKSNRCKLNKAGQKVRQKCFHFQTFVCVLGTQAYAIMNRIFYSLNEIWPLHRFKLADHITREQKTHSLMRTPTHNCTLTCVVWVRISQCNWKGQ